jgi:hypothetical protein
MNHSSLSSPAEPAPFADPEPRINVKIVNGRFVTVFQMAQSLEADATLSWHQHPWKAGHGWNDHYNPVGIFDYITTRADNE